MNSLIKPGINSVHQQWSADFLDVPCFWRSGRLLVFGSCGMVFRCVAVRGILE